MSCQDINVTIGSANAINVSISGGFAGWAGNSTNYAGSACSGTDGATGRTLTHTTDAVKLVVIDNLFYQPTYDYTLTGSVITINKNVWDDQQITIWN